MNKIVSYAALVVAGALVGAAGYAILGGSADGVQSAGTAERKPLYWVSPMNPDYKRDKPGKSPMGMDLIPVYAEGGDGDADSPGTVRVSPDVVNNLGVTTALVQMGRLVSEIKTVGYVQFDEDQLVHIHPRVEGWIETLFVKADGDPVVKGAPLYAIYSPNLVNAQEELVLALNRKNPALIEAAEDRLRSLEVPEAAIRSVRQTRKVSQTVTISAPHSGVVDQLKVREGFYVQPGSLIMSIGVLDEVWVAGEVFERQAELVNVGDSVVMTLDYLPGRTWPAKIDYVYPTLSLLTRTAKIRIRLDNPGEELKPGMFAKLTILEKADQERLLVPRRAIIRTGNQDRVVLAMGEGKFKSIEVKIGRVGEKFAEILSGLNAGEEIVTSAQFLLDSESSKTSDFKRMNPESDTAASLPDSVWAQATVNSVMPGHRMVNVTHLSIGEWGWPSMTMDFVVDEAVDITALKKGTTLQVQISKSADKQYRISGVRMLDSQSAIGKDGARPMQDKSAETHQSMNHKTMDMAGQPAMPAHEHMNHEGIDMDGQPAMPAEHKDGAEMESGHD